MSISLTTKNNRLTMPETTKPWFLYVIECQDNSLYAGVAVDVMARYTLHESGKGARYTRSHPPKQLLMVMEYPDRSSALKAEYAFKQLKPAKKKWEFIVQQIKPA